MMIGIIVSALQQSFSEKAHVPQQRTSVEVLLGTNLTQRPFTGRVYVFLSRHDGVEPRKHLRLIHAEPMLAKEVFHLQPNQSVFFSLDDPKVLRFPRDLKSIDLNGMRAQAIVRLNEFDPDVNNAEGNGFSEVAVLNATDSKPIRLTVDKIIPRYKFPGTARRREFTVVSKRLSKFYGSEISLLAAVILPEGYDSTDTTYPVVFHVPSFGGSHHFAKPLSTQNDCGVDFIHVMLDARCRFGHHVFADSVNTGPYQSAFVEEFLPAFEKSYRAVSNRQGRFLTGNSSGAWSALWLQINHPETFAGAWSFSPDPVDFSDFQNINLYQARQNMFRDPSGERRPLNHQEDGTTLIWFDELSDLEHVMGRGGQLCSFEAVFGPRGTDGRPVPLWNRDTGAIDSEVAREWEKYDILGLLKSTWPSLADHLRGRIHIHVDDHDNYFLDGGVKRMASSFADRPDSVEVTIHPGWGHGTYMTEDFIMKVNTEMAKSFLRETTSSGAVK